MWLTHVLFSWMPLHHYDSCRVRTMYQLLCVGRRKQYNGLVQRITSHHMKQNTSHGLSPFGQEIEHHANMVHTTILHGINHLAQHEFICCMGFMQSFMSACGFRTPWSMLKLLPALWRRVQAWTNDCSLMSKQTRREKHHIAMSSCVWTIIRMWLIAWSGTMRFLQVAGQPACLNRSGSRLSIFGTVPACRTSPQVSCSAP